MKQMRTEQEMFDLILNTANADDRIRAVYMNGSRTNPNTPKDSYQDYDIVFVVTETDPFLKDKDWYKAFGEITIVQEPDWNGMKTGLYGGNYDFTRRYAWLMLFTDGNRIDLCIEIKDEALVNIKADKLTAILLDKDNIFPEITPPTDEDYHVKKPNQDEYTAYCNNFWWCLNNVAKGIARDELPYAMEMYNTFVRSMLNGMIDWYIGILTDFSVSAGKMGKYYKKYLPPEIFSMYAKTYSDSDYCNLWTSIFIACELFHETALSVSKNFNFSYRQYEEDGIREYLKAAMKPEDAEQAEKKFSEFMERLKVKNQ